MGKTRMQKARMSTAAMLWNYKIYSHDFCVHIHTQNTPTAGTNFF